MVIKKLIFKLFFFKLFFVVGLFIFFNAFAQEYENFSAFYLGNDNRVNVKLSLINDNNLFEINYVVYSGPATVSLKLNSDSSIYIKSIYLDEKFIHIDSRFLEDELMGLSFMHRRRNNIVYFNFNRYKFEWRGLINAARGRDLKFCVFCVDVESEIERKYEFRVSAATLSKLVDAFELSSRSFI
ncbi:hypothetical protein A7978_04745 (plasmid) [Borrelia turicatae]|uniref:Uncharacterized protein n=2 Tax=Borrelia turicatae TaxID=142 RepID=T1ECN7_BORT9|nr:hypothetical protein [Borrelia turicatae]ADN26508.1 hypothetical protein BTA079 [Borrelia turicatae 91E135]ANF34421.1 hypothetical protein A7978_04745 [Borrelia turicatae]UPA14005.1 hypothetical protein bt91E135_001169 [Borrelia turicatae 91E135]UPA15498.1 hypothetical protein btBTE5EL_001180 [Borrelia turicatae]